MLTVLIVDDHLLTREMLRKIIDWESLELRLIGEAYNGEEAFSFILNNKVDIVITDIKMPVMDGVELIIKVREMDLDIEFIVLSAYNEFDIVRQVFNYGIKQYILKDEIEKHFVEKVLAKTIQDFNQTMKMKKRCKVLENCVDNNRFFLKSELLKKLLWQSKECVQEYADESLGFYVCFRKYCVMMVKVFDNNTKENELYIYSSSEMTKTCLRIINGLLAETCRGEVCSNGQNEYVIVAFFVNVIGELDIKQKMIFLFGKIKAEIEDVFNCAVCGGLSGIENTMDHLQKLYYNVLKALNNFFIAGKGHIILYENIAKGSNISVEFCDKKIKAFTSLLNEVNKISVEEFRNYLYEIVVPGNKILSDDIDTIRKLYGKYYSCLLQYRNDLFITEEIEKMISFYDDVLKNTGDINDLNEWLKKVLESIFKIALGGNRFVTRAKKFIQAHIREDIYLNNVAEYVGISGGHLSRLFRNIENTTFTNYLLEARILYAIDYMKNNNTKIYEVSEIMGFSSPENFSRAFKKVTGKSPKDYLS